MKKTFKVFALMLLTAFAFSSCVDVPAPFNLPDKSSSTSGDGGSSTNEGTPVTCAKAAELTKALADGATSTETYTITGYITEVIGDVSRNQQTFWMADTKDGGRVFEAYWANLPDGVTAFTAGTKVKITGKLMKYVNANNGNVTPEMKNATVEILADDGSGDTPAPAGTEITCTQAVELTNALANSGTSSETYTITGYITQVIGEVSTKTGSPQQSFWISDNKGGNNQFQAYYANLPTGVNEFTVGMKVKITGKLKKFMKNDAVVPEMQNPTVVIVEDGGDTPTPGPQGDVQHITIEEFLAKADQNTTYELTGTVRNITNTTYGNFDLVEGNSSIYIYGLLDLSGAKQKFASLGIAEGDVVTLTGKYKLFNNKPEIENAQFVSVTKGQGGGGDEPTPGTGGDPVTDLVNGDFESWVNDAEATGWKSACSASNAAYSKSEDAHGGTYACQIAASGAANKRLATQELTLEAGTYTFSFYAKSTTANASQTRPGHVTLKADGSVDTYYYPKNGTESVYFNLKNDEWTLVTYDFELTARTTLCLIVMNPKNSTYSVSQDILVDDATLTKK